MADSDLNFTAPLPLGAWYADPMSAPQAAALLEQVHRERQRAHQQGRACPNCGLYELIARFWLDRPVTAGYETLRDLGPAPRERALLDLIMGQLRMSRRLRGALELLRQGFFTAAPHLQARDYFELLRRHELLAYLPLSDRPAAPQPLAALLTEAAVIRRLRGRPPGPAGRRDDTVG